LKKRDQRSPVVSAAFASSEISSPLVKDLCNETHILVLRKEGRYTSMLKRGEGRAREKRTLLKKK
jgi:hypothetical protein